MRSEWKTKSISVSFSIFVYLVSNLVAWLGWRAAEAETSVAPNISCVWYSSSLYNSFTQSNRQRSQQPTDGKRIDVQNGDLIMRIDTSNIRAGFTDFMAVEWFWVMWQKLVVGLNLNCCLECLTRVWVINFAFFYKIPLKCESNLDVSNLIPLGYFADIISRIVVTVVTLLPNITPIQKPYLQKTIFVWHLMRLRPFLV